MAGTVILCPGFSCDRINPEIQHRQRQGPAIGAHKLMHKCRCNFSKEAVSSVPGLWDQRVTEKLHWCVKHVAIPCPAALELAGAN